MSMGPMPTWQQTEAHGDQGLQPHVCSQGHRHTCAVLFMDTRGHIAAALMPSYLGHSHLDTHHMIVKACPHQWLGQFAADPGSPSGSLGGPSLTQNNVCWVFKKPWTVRVTKGISRTVQGFLMPLAALSLSRAVIVFSSIKWDPRWSPSCLLCHKDISPYHFIIKPLVEVAQFS